LSSLGKTLDGTPVSRLGLGCFYYGKPAPEDSVRAIRRALELGVNLLDTSDAYGAGENERMVGEAVGRRRHAAYITTKFGWVLDSSGKPTHLDGSTDHVRRSCEASLQRLGTDYIDLYIAHRVDTKVPIEETVGELSRLVEEGKVRAIGLSEAGRDTIERAHRVAPLGALQTEYSLWSRDPEAELVPLCSRLGIAFVAYSPLGRGFLTGSVRDTSDLAPDDYRHGNPRFEQSNLGRNLGLVDELSRVASRMGHTPSQLALAWLLSRPGAVYPIPSTRNLVHLEENAAAADLALSPRDLEAIGNAVPPDRVSGARHPAEHMKTIGR
jgi:aryl-alcohol dehydrogenase-like predicted oxidoreductase